MGPYADVFRSLITVDYNRSYFEAYRDATKAVISWTGQIYILHAACHREKSPESASWAPEWNSPHLHSIFPDELINPGVPPDNAFFRFIDDDARVLVVRGLVLGQVSAVISEPFQYTDPTFNRFNYDLLADEVATAVQHWSTICSHTGMASPNRVFRQLIELVRRHNELHDGVKDGNRFNKPDLKQWLRRRLLLDAASLHDDLVPHSMATCSAIPPYLEMDKTFIKITHGRRLFLTKDGSLGVSLNIERGDYVVHIPRTELRGCEPLFVIREAEGSLPAECKLVGHARLEATEVEPSWQFVSEDFMEELRLV
jgi:hypothetical protein